MTNGKWPMIIGREKLEKKGSQWQAGRQKVANDRHCLHECFHVNNV